MVWVETHRAAGKREYIPIVHYFTSLKEFAMVVHVPQFSRTCYLPCGIVVLKTNVLLDIVIIEHLKLTNCMNEYCIQGFRHITLIFFVTPATAKKWASLSKSMLDTILQELFGSSNDREVSSFKPLYLVYFVSPSLKLPSEPVVETYEEKNRTDIHIAIKHEDICAHS